MRYLVAPDKFKGSMSAAEAAEQIGQGIKDTVRGAELDLLPLSDGGEGLIETLCGSGKGTFIETIVTGPLGKPVKAKWGITNDSNKAVIEMAAASGLELVPVNKRNPALTTTYGTGQLIRAALDHGCSDLIVGIGGSATNDGGVGMAQALGASFKDSRGDEIGCGGAELIRLSSIDLSNLDPRLKKVAARAACDVNNPLTGSQGASQVYGPQKGADPETALFLDRALTNLAAVVKKELQIDLEQVSGGGAAGGLGAGLFAFLNAELTPGIELVLDTLNFNKYLKGCHLVITGEGSLDSQSLQGKTPVGVARRAAACSVPVIALAGRISGSLDLLHKAGITACFAIADGPLSLEESMRKAPDLLRNKTAELMRFWLAGK
jgi:glycerate kinase